MGTDGRFQMLSRRSFLAVTGGALAAPSFSWGAETLSDVPVVLDHILLGCSDLDMGIAFVEQHTGVRAAFGGVHPGRGTRNALLSLGEKHYLEIIAPDPEQPDAPDSFGLRKLEQPKPITWAAHPGSLDEFAKRLRSANLAFDGPTPGSRKRLDGRLLQWKTINLHENYGGVLPFFIEWSADTTHPSVDAPSGCQLVHFMVCSPHSAEIERLFHAIDIPILVGTTESPQLLARITGRGRDLTFPF